LAQILHDWPDEDARKILITCATAMAPGARLLIVEQVLSGGDAQTLLPAVTDINMLVLVGGQERNAAEYGTLLDEAGFTDMAVRPTGGAWTVVEATRR
jgi:hypothetical protein